MVQDLVETYRQQVQRILASKEFTGLQHVREFLLYVSEAAFEGRASIDQVEIAERVLHRRKDFNPLDDASVRKCATILRQRLKAYYESEGAVDPVRISLPVRSYIPQFEVRELKADPRPASNLAPEPSRRRWLAVAVTGAVCVAVSAALAIGWRGASSPDVRRPVFELTTVPGDIMHEQNNLPGDAIRLGLPVGEVDDVTVRMRFTPERATQQAGLFVYVNPDLYVKLGRQFFARPQLEFGAEQKARYLKPPQTFTYDPDAQSGEPVWLSIRRNQSKYTGYVGKDGLQWRRVGNVLDVSEQMTGARAAIFADNGRSNAPPAQALFDRLSVGLAFHSWPEGPADLSQFAGWQVDSTDPAAPRAWSFDPEALIFPFATSAQSYNCQLVKPLPKGDWVISTRLDFLPLNGSAAGLVVRGRNTSFRFIRWDLDGGSVTAELSGRHQANRKDYEGWPPIVLRIECRRGTLRSSFSRDDKHFTSVPLDVSVRDLGDNPQYGLSVSTSSWIGNATHSPARFYYVRQEVNEVSNYR